MSAHVSSEPIQAHSSASAARRPLRQLQPLPTQAPPLPTQSSQEAPTSHVDKACSSSTSSSSSPCPPAAVDPCAAVVRPRVSIDGEVRSAYLSRHVQLQLQLHDQCNRLAEMRALPSTHSRAMQTSVHDPVWRACLSQVERVLTTLLSEIEDTHRERLAAQHSDVQPINSSLELGLPWKQWQATFWAIKSSQLHHFTAPFLSWFKQQAEVAQLAGADWPGVVGVSDEDPQRTLAKLACSILECVVEAPNMGAEDAVALLHWMQTINARKALFNIVPACFAIVLRALAPHSTSARLGSSVDLARMRDFFDSIPVTSRDHVTFTLMRQAYVADGCAGEAEDLHRTMEMQGLASDAVSNNQRMQRCSDEIVQCRGRSQAKCDLLYLQAQRLWLAALADPAQLMDSFTLSIMLKVQRLYAPTSVQPIFEMLEAARDAEEAIEHKRVFVTAAVIGQLHSFLASQSDASRWCDGADREWHWLLEAERKASAHWKCNYRDPAAEERWKQLRCNDLVFAARTKFLIRIGRTEEVQRMQGDRPDHAQRTPMQVTSRLNSICCDDDHEGHRIPRHTFAAIVDGEVERYLDTGGVLDIFIIGAWIGCYAKRGDVDGARRAWTAMRQAGIQPSSTAYSKLILTYLEASSHCRMEQRKEMDREIDKLLQEMCEGGIERPTHAAARAVSADGSSPVAAASAATSSSVSAPALRPIEFEPRDLVNLAKTSVRLRLFDWATEWQTRQGDAFQPTTRRSNISSGQSPRSWRK